jgi:hypothetical protein
MKAKLAKMIKTTDRNILTSDEVRNQVYRSAGAVKVMSGEIVPAMVFLAEEALAEILEQNPMVSRKAYAEFVRIKACRSIIIDQAKIYAAAKSAFFKHKIAVNSDSMRGMCEEYANIALERACHPDTLRFDVAWTARCHATRIVATMFSLRSVYIPVLDEYGERVRGAKGRLQYRAILVADDSLDAVTTGDDFEGDDEGTSMLDNLTNESLLVKLSEKSHGPDIETIIYNKDLMSQIKQMMPKEQAAYKDYIDNHGEAANEKRVYDEHGIRPDQALASLMRMGRQILAGRNEADLICTKEAANKLAASRPKASDPINFTEEDEFSVADVDQTEEEIEEAKLTAAEKNLVGYYREDGAAPSECVSLKNSPEFKCIAEELMNRRSGKTYLEKVVVPLSIPAEPAPIIKEEAEIEEVEEATVTKDVSEQVVANEETTATLKTVDHAGNFTTIHTAGKQNISGLPDRPVRRKGVNHLEGSHRLFLPNNPHWLQLRLFLEMDVIDDGSGVRVGRGSPLG